MRAIILEKPREPLRLRDVPKPEPGNGEIVIRVEACAVCRTDLHVASGELAEPKLPLIPGHQIAGVVESSGSQSFQPGDRAGVPWLAWTCGECRFCTSGRENLCDRARFTGYTVDGGFAEYAVADARFCFRLPDSCTASEAAPLLCAGLIGHRAYGMTGDAGRIGFYGFGSSAQIVAQIAAADGRKVFAFTRDGDDDAQQYALDLGAAWAGGSGDAPPHPLDAAIVFASDGALVVTALRNIVKGGVVVCAGIHMTDIPSFPYSLLWGERAIRSVANLTRADGEEFFRRLETLRVKTKRTSFPLERANEALDALRWGEITGTAVLEVSS